jgi:hypothetical protein
MAGAMEMLVGVLKWLTILSLPSCIASIPFMIRAPGDTIIARFAPQSVAIPPIPFLPLNEGQHQSIPAGFLGDGVA